MTIKGSGYHIQFHLNMQNVIPRKCAIMHQQTTVQAGHK